jgi:hypothetical protein
MQYGIPNPIIVDTIEEKRRILKEQYEKTEKSYDSLMFPGEPKPNVLTMDELIERNKEGRHHPELLPSYFVKSDGDDTNDGTKDKPFKSLSRALETVKTGTIKRIMILDTLTGEHEPHHDKTSAFIIENTGEEEIIITGLYEYMGLEATNTHDSYKRVVRVSSNAHIKFEYICIKGGNAGSYLDEKYGGGILVMYGGIVTIGKDCDLSNNSASIGGGIAVLYGGILKVDGGKIYQNSAEHRGGGIYVGFNSVCDMKSGIISDNTAQNSGGGIYIDNSDIYVGYTVFIDHESGSFTQKINECLYRSTTADNNNPYPNTDKGIFLFKGGMILNNHSEDGGGVSIHNLGFFEMSGGQIAGNMASSGGGMYIHGGSCKLLNGIIIGNRAKGSGGGACVYYYDYKESNSDCKKVQISSLEIRGGVISGNIAGKSGGGIKIHANKTPECVNVTFSSGIISGNIAENDTGGGIDINGGSCLMTGNAILCGNIAKEYGGGICIKNDYSQDGYGIFILDENALISTNIVGMKFETKPEKEWIVVDASTVDISTGVIYENINVRKIEPPPGLGGGIYVCCAHCKISGGFIKNNIANKGGGVFVAAPLEFSVFKQSSGEITANAPEDVFQEKSNGE